MTSISARPYRGARPFPQAYPGKGRLLKGAKNIPRVLQSYATYDTLRQHMNLRTAYFNALSGEGIAMSKQAEFAVILKMNPMFADLGADELQRISSLCHTQNLGVGEMLFQKGDPGGALFGVRRGQPTELFVLRREDFLAHLEREPRVAIKLIQLLCQRIRWMSERMEESVLQPLPVRLARRLCALASDFGSEVHISQEQLGVFVGAARESVNRQLQQWRKEGILDLQRGRILLQNMTKLTAVARNEE